MPELINSDDLSAATNAVLSQLVGIDELYPSQLMILNAIFENDNIFYTGSTNSGKTLPTVMYPEVLNQLNAHGYNFPKNPKSLFVTALNSLQLSLFNNTKSIGLHCDILTGANAEDLLNSTVFTLFISPETLKLPEVTRLLLEHRKSFVLKVIDEAHLGNYYLFYV